MLESIAEILKVMSAFSPLGIITLLGTIILLLVHKDGPIRKMSDNHLSHVQDSLDKIADHSERQVDLLVDISNDINYVKGKLDK